MLAIRRAHMCADDAPLERQHGKLCLWKKTKHNLKFTSFIKEKCNQNMKTKLKFFLYSFSTQPELCWGSFLVISLHSS